MKQWMESWGKCRHTCVEANQVHVSPLMEAIPADNNVVESGNKMDKSFLEQCKFKAAIFINDMQSQLLGPASYHDTDYNNE